MVESVGFEPTETFLLRSFSKRVLSATQPTLLYLVGTGYGNRTRLYSVKGCYPKPIDEPRITGGRGGIRTHGRLAPTSVFKTEAINHSATLP